MSYLEEMLELAKEKGIDPEKVLDDLVTAANASGWGVEDIAYSFLMATRWKPEIMPEMFAELDQEKQ